jgi:hypothetical protein
MHAVGGSIHRVIAGYYHMMFHPGYLEYDIALLRVGTEFDVPVDSAKLLMCLQ